MDGTVRRITYRGLLSKCREEPLILQGFNHGVTTTIRVPSAPSQLFFFLNVFSARCINKDVCFTVLNIKETL